jgi:hypothetical protein
MGFLYIPAFAVLFAPFYQLGAQLVEFAVLSYAAFLQVRRIDRALGIGLSGIEPHILRSVYQWYQPTASTLIFLGIMWWFWRRTRVPGAETVMSGAYA